MKQRVEYKDITKDDARIVNEALWQIQEWIEGENVQLR